MFLVYAKHLGGHHVLEDKKFLLELDVEEFEVFVSFEGFRVNYLVDQIFQ